MPGLSIEMAMQLVSDHEDVIYATCVRNLFSTKEVQRLPLDVTNLLYTISHLLTSYARVRAKVHTSVPDQW